MPDQGNDLDLQQENPALEEISMPENMTDTAFEQTADNLTQAEQAKPMQSAEQDIADMPVQSQQLAQQQAQTQAQVQQPVQGQAAPQAQKPVQTSQPVSAQDNIDSLFDNPVPQAAQAAPSQMDIDNLFDNPAPQAEPVKIPQAAPVNVIDELPTFDDPENHAQAAHAEAADMVEEFLGKPEPKQEEGHALPQDLADDLLAEMGFNDK